MPLQPKLGEKSATPLIKPWYIDRPEKIITPIKGSRKALVLLVDFSDKPHSYSSSEFTQLLFNDGTGSMKDYYNKVSYGEFSLDGVAAEWVRAPHPYSYYCNKENSPHGFGDYPGNVFGLVEDAVKLADANVDFSQFDLDGDGYVEALFVVHSGAGAEESGDSNVIWSHKSSFGDAHEVIPAIPEFVEVDGVKVNVYSMEPESLKNAMITIGVFCHEFGHVLGLPDLYDIDYSSVGVGNFCIMASGSWLGNPTGSSPAHFCAWCKYAVGWIEPIALERNGTMEIKNAQIQAVANSPTVYRLLENPSGTSDWLQGSGTGEYFLVENRQQIGYDSYIPGGGLLILHIDESEQTNKNDNNPLVGIMQADGNTNPSLDDRGSADDLWKDDSMGFSTWSIPASYFYNGTPSGISVSKISSSNTTMTANLKLSPILLNEVYTCPNPFIKKSSQDCVTFKYTASSAEETDTLFPNFSVKIFNLSGRLIKSLTGANDGNLYKRELYWNGKNNIGSEIASGLYYYLMEIPERNERMKGKLTFIH